MNEIVKWSCSCLQRVL